MRSTLLLTTVLCPAALIPLAALADGGHAVDMPGAIRSAEAPATAAPFDILAAHVHRDGRTLVFHMTTRGPAGSETPRPAGQLGGAPVLSYVWPTSLDPAAAGFEAGTGILALAATSHPDFDDTPLFDETGDGDPANDGAAWHSHWVVLTATEACGPGALAVRDIPEGTAPALPPTWPGLPIFIDSPGYSPIFDGPEIRIAVPAPAGSGDLSYDGVTAALAVNANLHRPLLCVTDVFDIGSGDLSLPGRVE